jgi:hypothetical protein
VSAGRQEPEPTWRDPPGDPVHLDASAARDVRKRDLLVRFGFGAATSVVAACVSLLFGPLTGGVLLAFPAILAASLTLIADEESARLAREDGRGAVVGAVALGAFATAGAVAFTKLASVLVLLVALAVWIAVAVGGYWLLWGRRRR